jgi:hypothetical protein
MRKSACAPQCLSLNPTADIGHPAGDFDHATVSMPNGMEFDVSVEGHALEVRLETDEAWPSAVMRRPWPPMRLPLSASGTKDGARLNAGRRQTR